AFADPWDACNPDTFGFAGVWQQPPQNLLGLMFVQRGIAFNQSNGSSQLRTVSGQNAVDIIVNGQRRPGSRQPLLRRFWLVRVHYLSVQLNRRFSSVKICFAASGMKVPGPNTASAPFCFKNS